MIKYGQTKEDLENSFFKIEKQTKYLSSQGFLTTNGEFKSFLQISMSANISERYYAQLINKVNTLQQVMTDKGLEPSFLTITLDGPYHRLLNGDYSSMTDKLIDKLPNNDRFGYLRDKANSNEFFTVKDLYKLLRYQWYNFQRSRFYINIKKQYDIGYLFEVEPHKSGVPHAHILFYAPRNYFPELITLFKKYFPARQNIRKDKLTFEQKQNGEINGFQTTLNNPVGYIMKYCTKSFMDIKHKKELDYLQSWYIKHKIVRLTTSRSLIPQWVYQKMYPLNNDWLYQSLLKLDGSCEWSKEDDYFIITDDRLKKVYKYERGLYQMYVDNKLVEQFGELKPKKIKNFKYRVDQKPMLKKKRRKIPKIQIVINGQIFDFYNKPISKRGDYDLLDYYYKLNPDDDSCNLKHFGLVQNECIQRGLIQGEIQSPNSFNLEIGA